MDGRRLRRQQNRDAVVDALLELYGEGRYDATAADVTARAGLSPRSLFRYFDDVDDVARAAIEHEQERARKLLVLDVGPEDALGLRIDRLVATRAELWEAVGPGARAARIRAPSTPVVADFLAENRRFLRAQIRSLFGADADVAALAAVDVLCSFESWELLRHDRRLSKQRAIAVLTRSLRALLAPTGGHR